jgi:hypothetical protein
MATRLERYLDGRRDEVWLELARLGAAVREPEHLADARAVAAEAMTRVRANVITLTGRLEHQGYRFGDEEDGATQAHAPPDAQTPAFVAWLEAKVGPLPLTLRAWIEIVGDVNFSGEHPSFPTEVIPAPLVVEVEFKSWPEVIAQPASRRRHVEEKHQDWLDAEHPDPFELEIADSPIGAPPWTARVPDASADATLSMPEGSRISLVQYLRRAFGQGGFTGLWEPGLGAAGRRALQELVAGLLPI